LGEFLDVKNYSLDHLKFGLKKNGHLVQSGNTKSMIFSIPQIIKHCSEFFTLKIGDLIFTGTPEGVGQVNEGDELEGFIEGKKVLHVKIR
jgi:2-keto-4-pentenoate hydratase/2-oxohepta-3-ene-1,7-dioic acid hydratase in catechol pathway